MAKRQKEWARRRRAKLIRILGGQCTVCHETHELTFDCLEPKGHEHHGKDTSARMSFYNQQFRAANLGLLCHLCNAIKAHCPKSVWEFALRFIGETEAIQSQWRTPGQGTALLPRERRECLVEAVRRYREQQEAQERVQDPF